MNVDNLMLEADAWKLLIPLGNVKAIRISRALTSLPDLLITCGILMT